MNNRTLRTLFTAVLLLALFGIGAAAQGEDSWPYECTYWKGEDPALNGPASYQLSPGDTRDVIITEEQRAVKFAFTPKTSGYYRFYSSGGKATYVYLFDERLSLLATYSDGPQDYNFDLIHGLQGGKTYYYFATVWYGPAQYQVHLEKLPKSGDYVYTTVSGGTMIVKYEGAGGEIEVPYSLGEHSIYSLGEGTFSGSGATRIQLPDCVRYIDAKAFSNCPTLTDISVRGSYYSTDGVLYQEGESKLWFCPEGKAGVLTLPRKVRNMGQYALWNANKLTGFDVEQDNRYFEARDGVLMQNGVLMRYPPAAAGDSYLAPEGITSIFSGAFRGCVGLESVNLPEGMIDIKDYAFSNCGNLTVTLNESLDNVDATAFEGTNETIRAPGGSIAYITCLEAGLNVAANGAAQIAGELPLGGSVDMTSDNSSLLYSFTTREAGNYRLWSEGNAKPHMYLFEPDFSLIRHVETPKYYSDFSVVFDLKADTTYYIRVFRQFRMDLSVHLSHEGILTDGGLIYTEKGDGEATLVGYTGNAAELTVPGSINGRSVTAVYDYAFQDNEVLTRVVLPGTVRQIGSNAFDGCSNLSDVTIPQSATMLGYDLFTHCPAALKVHTPMFSVAWDYARKYRRQIASEGVADAQALTLDAPVTKDTDRELLSFTARERGVYELAGSSDDIRVYWNVYRSGGRPAGEFKAYNRALGGYIALEAGETCYMIVRTKGEGAWTMQARVPYLTTLYTSALVAYLTQHPSPGIADGLTDPNGDGEIDLRDAAMAMKHISWLEE